MTDIYNDDDGGGDDDDSHTKIRLYFTSNGYSVRLSGTRVKGVTGGLGRFEVLFLFDDFLFSDDSICSN
jgi:hypothetical protein